MITPSALEKARSAVDASAILASAQEFASVEDAVADCSLVVGTTAVGERKQEHPLYTLAEGGGLIALRFVGRRALRCYLDRKRPA